MNARSILCDCLGQTVAFNTDGWINATVAAARFDKAPQRMASPRLHRGPYQILQVPSLCKSSIKLHSIPKEPQRCTWKSTH
ncbi:hypothetical protein EMIT0373P_31001 [Pseudomonas chlororaphis]